MNKKTNKPKQLYLPFEGMICNGRKSLKKLLFELGFHHSWGYFIHNNNDMTRIIVNKTYMEISKNRNNFNYEDNIRFFGKPIEEVTIKLKRYFNLN
jgi:hypothetical protein